MNELSIKVRSLARRLGVIRLLHRLRPAQAYEDQFHKALRAAILPGHHLGARKPLSAAARQLPSPFAICTSSSGYRFPATSPEAKSLLA